MNTCETCRFFNNSWELQELNGLPYHYEDSGYCLCWKIDNLLEDVLLEDIFGCIHWEAKEEEV